ncbi:armadillo-type protein [Gorgonomyces haynaldii]|nr:armadillo-type protein [Gorgonomyces haynaldii]
MREKVMGMIASSKGFVLNKIATVVVLLFQQDYLTHWPTFFNELYQWSAHLDFFLLILENIHDQIVSQVFHRTNKEVQENTLIKDHMRLEAVPLLMNLLREFLMSHLTKPLIANRILKIIGCYVEWVDINLVVNPEFLPLLLTCFQDHQLMLNAAECMGEIVLKGMKAPEKIQLIQLLNLVPLLTPQDDPMLEEGLSRLVNHLGVELMRVYEDGTPEEKQASIQLVEPLLIHLLRYLSNEYDDTAMQTFGFLTIYLQNLKKNPKLVDGQFLMQLLQILIVKSKFDPEADPDQEDEFGEFRKSLKSYMESVAAIDMNLYTTCVSNLVLTTLDNKSLDWTDAELVLHLIFIYSEAMTTYQSIQPGEKIKGQSLFVQNQQPTALGLMLSKMFESGVSGYPHPSIPVLYFEILIRYHVFLQLDPKYFPEALQTFLDARGLHHPKRSIRMRLDYLFLRFTKLLRKEMVQFVDHIISGLVDILVIQDRVREKSLVPTKEHESSGQFHLFEALGFLITTETIPEDKQAGYLYFLQQPLLLMISNQLETQDLVQIWKLGDLVSSLGALYKAFPENCNQSLGQQGQQALSCIVTVLGKHRQYVHVRECTRNAIQRMTNGLGVHVLESIPLLLTNGLIGEDSELIEFMPFLGLLVHKFGPQIQQVMETLWHPLFVKIQTFLAQVPIGTDDLVNQDTLLKHFLQLLTTLFSYDLYRILVQPGRLFDGSKHSRSRTTIASHSTIV